MYTNISGLIYVTENTAVNINNVEYIEYEEKPTYDEDHPTIYTTHIHMLGGDILDISHVNKERMEALKTRFGHLDNAV